MKSTLYCSNQSLGLMTHLIAGYPSIEENLRLLRVMAEKQVDIIEIQMPFSEPMADGPLFVKANQRAIAGGMTIKKYFKLLKQAVDIYSGAILMMGYYNTVFSMGEEIFLKQLIECGAKGFIIPDLPREYSGVFYRNALDKGIYAVQLVAPNTPDQRLKTLAKEAQGILYAVARRGVTGSKTKLDDHLSAYLLRLKKQFNIPVAVGFGISSAEDMVFLQGKADVAVVGSRLLSVYLEKGIRGVEKLLDTLNQARS